MKVHFIAIITVNEFPRTFLKRCLITFIVVQAVITPHFPRVASSSPEYDDGGGTSPEYIDVDAPLTSGGAVPEVGGLVRRLRTAMGRRRPLRRLRARPDDEDEEGLRVSWVADPCAEAYVVYLRSAESKREISLT